MSEHKNLAEALAAFQAEVPTVEKGKKAAAGKYSYEYASLDDVTAKVLPLLGKHGLAWITRPTLRDDGQFVLVYELRFGGQMVNGSYPLPPASTAPQQLGSAITYARRYALTAVTGVAPGGDDDDAQAAQQAPRAQAPATFSPERWDEWSQHVHAAATKTELRAVYQDASKAGVLPLTVPDAGVPFSQLLQEIARTLPDEAPDVETGEPEEATHA